MAQWPDWFARFGCDLRPERMGLRFDRAMMSLEVQTHFMVYPARHASRPEVKCFVEWLRWEAGY